MKTAVSNLLHGLPIQGYYSMNISGISEVGKLVGDVEIVVPDRQSVKEVRNRCLHQFTAFFLTITVGILKVDMVICHSKTGA